MKNNIRTDSKIILSVIIVSFLISVFKPNLFSNIDILGDDNNKQTFFENKVLLSQLPEAEQDAAYDIYKSILKGKRQIGIPLMFNRDTVSKILSLLQIECPELMDYIAVRRIWTQYISMIPIYRYLEVEYYYYDREEYKMIEEQIEKGDYTF